MVYYSLCANAAVKKTGVPNDWIGAGALGERAEKISASSRKFARFTIVKSFGILYNILEYVNMGK